MAQTKIASQVIAELNRQLNHELAAAHAYQALSLWCSDENLTGFASFFAKQAAEEREHAGKIADHLLDRDSRPKLDGIAAPKQDFKSLLDVAQQAQVMEQANTQGINTVYEAAVAAKDYPTQVLMHWFINEQIEEEAWCTEMVQRVQAASCAGGMSDLDRHIERYLAKGGGE
jgi:ferritin